MTRQGGSLRPIVLSVVLLLLLFVGGCQSGGNDVDNTNQEAKKSVKNSVIEDVDARKLRSIANFPLPLLAEFYLPSCGHCIAFAPLYEMVGTDLWAGGYTVVKADVKTDKATAKSLGVRGVPTVFLFESANTYEEYIEHRDYLSIFKWARAKSTLSVLSNEESIARFFPKRLTPIPRIIIVSEEKELAETLHNQLKAEALIGYLHPQHEEALKKYLGSGSLNAKAPYLLVSDSIPDTQRQHSSRSHNNDKHGMPYYYFSHAETTDLTQAGVSVVEEFMREVISHNVAVCTGAGLFEIGKSESKAFYVILLILVLIVGIITLVCICNKIQTEEKEYETKFGKGNKKR